MFDDNYIPGHGDNLSAKKLCNPEIYPLLNNPSLVYQDNFAQTSYRLSNEKYLAQVKQFQDLVDTYAEFPPIWNGPNRFGITEQVWSNISQTPLFTFESFGSSTGVKRDVSESLGYTHFVYIELSH